MFTNHKATLGQLTDEQMADAFKINLPASLEDIQSGNGEGIWALALNAKDLEMILDNQSQHQSAHVILLNDSWYYPNLLNWGTQIQVITQGSKRPVLDTLWLDELMKQHQMDFFQTFLPQAFENKLQLLEKLKNKPTQ